MADDPILDTRVEVPLASRRAHRRRAAHLYGLIVSGSVLAAAPDTISLGHVALILAGTLAVYWAAETYAHWTAARIVEGRDLRPEERVEVLTDGLPLLAACGIPVSILTVESLVGVSTTVGINVALCANVSLLLIVGWNMSRAGGLRGWRHVVASLTTGLLGVAMIALKLGLH